MHCHLEIAQIQVLDLSKLIGPSCREKLCVCSYANTLKDTVCDHLLFNNYLLSICCVPNISLGMHMPPQQ